MNNGAQAGDISRFSSRRQRLDRDYLSPRLRGARSYRRIAGYFRSSIFELVGEEIAGIPKVQIVCNSELDAADIEVSKHAREMALTERWNDDTSGIDTLLHRERYRRLYELLKSGRVEVRVVAKDRLFLHGKAGVIEQADGTKRCFIGSANESRPAFAENYEILWEDTSEEGVAWVEEEFSALWQQSHPLPDAIVEEVKRLSERVEVRFEDVSSSPGQLIPATLVESPIYRSGERLQPWQRAFVTMFAEHHATYGQTRLLLGDEVGLGKTLSLAASAMLSALLDDAPVLILCPSTLTLQWQVEMADKLGIPSAVWTSAQKTWLDPNGHLIKTRGAEDIARCPFRIAVVSTGLIVHGSPEAQYLLERSYGTVVLDEAHKARQRGPLGHPEGTPNNLLDFMLKVGYRTKNLLLATATPIQTDVRELWDLLRILNTGARSSFVLGSEYFSNWRHMDQALPVVRGEHEFQDEKEAWQWVKDPLPPESADPLFANLRLSLGIPPSTFVGPSFTELNYLDRETLRAALDPDFLREHNPVIRHTVLRRRKTLEEAGLLDRIAVEVHPRPEAAAYPGVPFDGVSLMTNHPFDIAYEAAEAFAKALGRRRQNAGFMKSVLLHRICSSFDSGRISAEKMLSKQALDEDEQVEVMQEALETLTAEEASYLRTITDELSRPEARDPKFAAVHAFLTQQYTSEGRTWLEQGCIVFSQFYDTVLSISRKLAGRLPREPIGVYAGAGRSGIYLGMTFAAVERESIKAAVKSRQIRLVVATDAACEGLNLQTLGTLINVDLPWNPARLEQRLGRIKRIGQLRQTVDMLNLVYNGTQDERVYRAISRRMKDRYDIFGGLPDAIDDDWIESAEKLEEMMDRYIHLRQAARDVFQLRYQDTIREDQARWETCTQVLARRDIVEKLSTPW
jgi:superfamily II DNA or RNA helicase/DNA-binding Lrp family transcriptional regulator